MPNIDEITDMARRLGIKLTNAEEGSELFKCWADRVLMAWNDAERGWPIGDRIAEANAYAI